MPPHISHLECSRCGKAYDHLKVNTVCLSCQGTLFARYDLEKVKNLVKKEDLRGRVSSMWRYGELLPVVDRANVVTLGEGNTPILKVEKLGPSLGVNELYVKDEAINPTGTFKARGQSVAVSKARELGIRRLAMASAGNAGGALAAYAARAGLEAHIFVPEDAPKSNIKECLFLGANVFAVPGMIDDAARAASSYCARNDCLNISTLREPYRVEGKKTMGFEVAEQSGWGLPDTIIYPTGGGTGLVGMWKAFEELEELGWIQHPKPRMVAVQSSGCAPVAKSFHEGKETVERFENAKTFAPGLRVPSPYAGEQILKVLRLSRGTAVSVPDQEILSAMTEFAKEGIYACPEGAATLAGLKRLLADGWINRDEKIFLYNTGSALKYIDLLAPSREPFRL